MKGMMYHGKPYYSMRSGWTHIEVESCARAVTLTDRESTCRTLHTFSARFGENLYLKVILPRHAHDWSAINLLVAFPKYPGI